MQPPSAIIKAFFDEYEQGANTFDLAMNRRERADDWLVASPNGVGIAHNDERFGERLAARHQQLLAMGYQSAAITSLTEMPLDDHYSLIKTAWRQKYAKNEQVIEVDITVDYIVRIEGQTAKIVCSIAHEDEDALLRAKGIITA